MLRLLRVPAARMSRCGGPAIAMALFALLVYPLVRPASADVAVGGSSAGFLGFEVGGRPAGMGGAQTASATGVTAQYWNPAGLTSLDRQQVGAMHATWLGDLSYEWLGYARPTGPSHGVTSLSIAYFHLPSIQGVDEFDNPTGSFNVYDMAVTAGYARSLGKGVSVGTNAKMIRENLATVAATGFAVDLGAMADLGGTKVGAVAQNLGPSMSFDGSSYPLPRQVRFGVSRELYMGRVLLAADYDMPSDYYNDFRFGTELRAHPNVSLRLGYRQEFGAASNDPATGFSFGLGLHLKQLSMDYAMTPSNEFDNVQRISFGYSFGSGPSEREEKPQKPEETKPVPPPPAPTGPPVIASRPATTAPAKPQASAAPPAAESAPPTVASSPTPAPSKAPETSSKTPAPSAYAVVLPGYSSKESAQAELKALALLGFRTKDAKIQNDSARGGYVIVLQRTKSKSSADDLVADLSKMSFRAQVQVVQR
jgi:hypothetical protein